MVKPGDTVKAEDALVSLESDKATMDVPAPLGGVVGELRVKVGDKVSEGTRDHDADDGTAQRPIRARRRRWLRGSQRGRLARSRRSARPRRRAARAVAAQARAQLVRRRGAVAAAAASMKHRFGARVREPRRAQGRARDGRRPRSRQGLRRQGSHPQGRRRGVREGRRCRGRAAPAAKAAAARGRRRRRHRPAAVAEGRLRQVRTGRNEAAVADQEDFRREPASQLGDDPARHQSRRRRHHRARELPRA